MFGQQNSMPNLAELRGRNWALPNAADQSIGVTRPIRVACSADQLVILPESRTGTRKTVALHGSTDSAVDEFVSAIWKHVEGWGIAGAGMYWKPVLRVEVAPGGEQRFQQLRQLLDRSGIDVRGKKRP